MRWTTPPTRRELTLLLFSLSVYILGANLEASLTTVGLDASRRAYLSKKLGLPLDPGLERDGRRPGGWRDEWEEVLVGRWEWEEGEVIRTWRTHGEEGVQGEETEREKEKTSQQEDLGRFQYDPDDLKDRVVYKKTASVKGPKGGLEGVRRLGPKTPQEGRLHWGSEVPKTRVVAHVPGYTILENLIYAKGTVYIVTDEPWTFPSLDAITSSASDPALPPGENEWQVVLPETAVEDLGDHGSKISGVTWLSTDPSSLHTNHTLPTFWRTYSTLSLSSTPTLPPPLRLIHPHIPTFSDTRPGRPGSNDPLESRPRSPAGFHPLLLKAAFPTTSVWYKEDWKDLEEMGTPFLVERVVVGDRGAARRAEGEGGPFLKMDAPKGWFDPVRKALLQYLALPSTDEPPVQKGFMGRTKATPKPVVTYLSRQEADNGLRLRGEDHRKLVDALRGLETHYGYEVNVVEVGRTGWEGRMRAVVRSTIVLGVYGDDLVDSAFMKPSARTTLMEFFPPETFARDQEVVVRSLGMRYVAWWNDKKFTGDALPLGNPPPSYSQRQEVAINAGQVAQAIREELSRRS